MSSTALSTPLTEFEFMKSLNADFMNSEQDVSIFQNVPKKKHKVTKRNSVMSSVDSSSNKPSRKSRALEMDLDTLPNI